MKHLFIILFIFFLFSFNNEMSLIWDEVEIVKCLLNEPINNKCLLSDYLNFNENNKHYIHDVYIVELSSDISGIFKPITANGLIENTTIGKVILETIAYKLSKFLGFPIIPPVVLREIDGELGSLHYFVNDVIHLGALREEDAKRFFNKVSKEEWAKIRLFQFIMGQYDCGYENMIYLTTNDTLIPIDYGACYDIQYVEYGTPPFVSMYTHDEFEDDSISESFPFKSVRTFSQNEVIDEKDCIQFLSSQLKFRFKRIKDPLKFVIWKKQLWRQYYYCEPAFVDYCSDTILDAFSRINYENLKQLFMNDYCCCDRAEILINGILDRRDQVLSYFKNK